MKTRAVEDFLRIVGKESCFFGNDMSENDFSNSLGIKRKIDALIYPQSREQVIDVVIVANKYKIPLYPISTGMNTGYGDKLPVCDGCVIVNLSKMNRILEFDNSSGKVRVEPGVTQKQLYEFLKANKSKFWMDATGASPDSSLMGNTLEGGFGHSPKGNRRKHGSDFEVVLGNGELVRTGAFPSMGPDLGSIFVQSNFGIVVSITMDLFPISEHVESFVVIVKDDEKLEMMINALRRMIYRGVVTNLAHIGNSIRTLTSLERPSVDGLLSEERAVNMLKMPLIGAGYWSVFGGLYGTKKEITIKKEMLKREMNGVGKITFFNDFKLNYLLNILSLEMISSINFFKKLRKRLISVKTLHGLLKGRPSYSFVRNSYWKVKKEEDYGLLWFSPTTDTNSVKIREVINTSREIYKKHGFEMPVTITFIDGSKVVYVFGIHFNKNNEEKEKAENLYSELKKTFENRGIYQYRTSILSMGEINYMGKKNTLLKIKKALDPNNIISPGRYGLNLRNSKG